MGFEGRGPVGFLRSVGLVDRLFWGLDDIFEVSGDRFFGVKLGW